MFVFLLEVLSGDHPQKAFFTPPGRRGPAVAGWKPGTTACWTCNTPAVGKKVLLGIPAPPRSLVEARTLTLAPHVPHHPTPAHIPPQAALAPGRSLSLVASGTLAPDSLFLCQSGCLLPPRLKKAKQCQPLSAAEFNKVKVLRQKAATVEWIMMTLGEQQELVALSASQFHYGRQMVTWDILEKCEHSMSIFD